MHYISLRIPLCITPHLTPLQIQGWCDPGFSRRAAAEDGLPGAVGLQQGKGGHWEYFAYYYWTGIWEYLFT